MQSAKQHSSGIGFFSAVFNKAHNHLKPGFNNGVITLDLFGYDGFSAEACFLNQLSIEGFRACGTVCHSYDCHKYVFGAISRTVYNSARRGDIVLPGFPKFDSLVTAMDAEKTAMANVAFNVCNLLPCGALVINETLVKKWMETECTTKEQACKQYVCVDFCVSMLMCVTKHMRMLIQSAIA